MNPILIIEREVKMEVYTFIDGVTKANTHIASGMLWEWVMEHAAELEVLMTPVDEEIARSMVEVDNAINSDNLKRLLTLPKLDPVIYCKTGTYNSEGAPDVMLVDGHHRYVFAAINRLKAIPGYLLEREQWEPFRIERPDMSEEELRAIKPKEVKS